MKRIVGLSAVALLFSFTLAAETFNDVVLDVMCQSGFETYIKASDKTTDVRIVVDGKLDGDIIAVTNVTIAD